MIIITEKFKNLFKIDTTEGYQESTCYFYSKDIHGKKYILSIFTLFLIKKHINKQSLIQYFFYYLFIYLI